MADDLTLAYLAGVIDSDGFISIHRSTRRGRTYFAAVIGIAGTRRQPHDLAASVWGGTVRCYDPPNPRHRPQFQWARTGDGALSAIYDVLPHLRVKEQQAWLAIECQEHVIEGRGPDPHPWMYPDYDPRPRLEEMRAEMVGVLNQDRRAPLDGRTWDEFPC